MFHAQATLQENFVRSCAGLKIDVSLSHSSVLTSLPHPIYHSISSRSPSSSWPTSSPSSHVFLFLYNFFQSCADEPQGRRGRRRRSLRFDLLQRQNSVFAKQRRCTPQKEEIEEDQITLGRPLLHVGREEEERRRRRRQQR